jgi:hypothetical protein
MNCLSALIINNLLESILAASIEQSTPRACPHGPSFVAVCRSWHGGRDLVWLEMPEHTIINCMF